VRTAELIRSVRTDSLTRNSVSIMATSVVNAGLGYLYWTAAARLLPATEVGLGSAVTSAMVILSLVVHLGAGAGLIARLPLRRSRAEWLLTALGTQLACGAVTLVLCIGALVPLAALVPPLRSLAANPAMAVWFVVGAVSWTGAGLLDYTFIAQRRSGLMFYRNAVSSAGKLIALVLVVVVDRHAGATAIVGTWAVSGLLGVAVGLLLCHRRLFALGRIRLRDARTELRALLRPTIGHHAISVAGLVPTYLLPVVVTAQLGTRANAYFYITWMVGSAIFMISPAVASAIFAEGSHDPSGMQRLTAHALRVVLALLVPAVVVLAAGGRLVLSAFGSGYAAAGYPLLLVLLASTLPDAVTNVAVSALRIRAALADAAVLNGSIATITVVGAALLTPRMGIIGAGWAWLGAQIIGALLVLVARRRIWPPETGA
jgi:O-antigen/teichoic acid export membrane protein